MDYQYGYFAGLKQPGLNFLLGVKSLREYNFNLLDMWLKDVFEVEVIPTMEEVLLEKPRLNLELIQIHQFATRILVIYNILMDGSHLPAVTLGRVTQVKAKGQQYEISLILPVVSAIAPNVFEQLLKATYQLSISLMSTPPTSINAQRIFDQLEGKLFKKVRLQMPDGRANSFIAGLAHKLGFPFGHLGHGLIQIGQGKNSVILQRSASIFDSAMGAYISADKFVTSNILRRAGFPVPENQLVNNVEAATKFANRLGWPVVLKPADRERGEGVTINICNDDELIQAYALASKLSKKILVEKQALGNNHRIFVVNDQLVFANKKYPKMLVGDGFSSVEDLITAYNSKQLQKPIWRRQKLAVMDDEALACTKKEQLAPDSIPADGQKVFLRQIGSDQWGSDKDTVTDIIHPENVNLAVQVARLLGLSVCGLDLMTVDISRPWFENGAVINEVNFKPFFGGDLKNDRAHPYLESMLNNKGRIPIHAILGDGDLWSAAREAAKLLSHTNTFVTITDANYSELSSGGELYLSSKGLFNRCQALLQNRKLDALVVIVNTDEFGQTGLPFDEISQLHLVAGEVESLQNIQKMLSKIVKSQAKI